MMRKFSWMLSALLVLAGYGAEITTEREEPKAVVETEPLLPDEITWDRDGSKMVLIPVVLLNCPIIPQGLGQILANSGVVFMNPTCKKANSW